MKITPKMEKRIDEMASEMVKDLPFSNHKEYIVRFLKRSSPMAQSNKEPWLQALRSGEYRQFKGQLACNSHRERRCCLGVAYGVCGLDFASPGSDYGTNRKNWIRATTEDADLPDGFMGMDHATQMALAKLNDTCFTHDQIADLIEEFL